MNRLKKGAAFRNNRENAFLFFNPIIDQSIDYEYDILFSFYYALEHRKYQCLFFRMFRIMLDKAFCIRAIKLFYLFNKYFSNFDLHGDNYFPDFIILR